MTADAMVPHLERQTRLPVEPQPLLDELLAIIERRRLAGDELPFAALAEHEQRLCREWGFRW